MVDEMYVQRTVQYQSGECAGRDKEGKLYNGIIVFMVAGF